MRAGHGGQVRAKRVRLSYKHTRHLMVLMQRRVRRRLTARRAAHAAVAAVQGLWRRYVTRRRFCGLRAAVRPPRPLCGCRQKHGNHLA